MKRAYRINTPEQFWAQATKGPDCRIWQGGTTNDGFANGTYEGVRETANRIAWRLTHGDLEDGAIVRRKCKNRLCVRPDHLELAMTPEQKAEAAALASQKHIRHADVAELYGLARPTVTRLVARARRGALA